MKKMMILTAASALLCTFMTGCTINVSDDAVSTAAEIAVSALDDAEIKVNDQQVDISLDSNGDINVNLAQTTVAAAQAENNSTTAAQTTIVTTAAPAQTAAPAEQTTAAQAVLTNAEMKDISIHLIQEYVSIYDGIMAGWTTVDDTDVYNPDSGNPYYRVMSETLQSIADVKTVIAKTLTGTEYDKAIRITFEDTRPLYLEKEGKLYTTPVGRGSAYSDSWLWDELQFTNVTADSFTVTGKYYHFGDEPFSQAFDVVRTADGFRISKAADIVYP